MGTDETLLARIVHPNSKRQGWAEMQALHDGNLYNVPDTLDEMRECAALAGMEFYGALHEIYLDEPLGHAPRHRRTILRQPLRDR